MEPSTATVRYRYGEGGQQGTDASFYGSFFHRSEAAVLSRLREVHRFAAWVEIVEVQWRGARRTGPAAGTEGAGRENPSS